MDDKYTELSEFIHNIIINSGEDKSTAIKTCLSSFLYVVINGLQHFPREKQIKIMNGLYAESLWATMKTIDQIREEGDNSRVLK